MGSGQEIGELRLRVEGSFTGTELRQLAQKWGLSAEPSWDRSPSDLVRGLLRDAERMFGKAELVRRLRSEKPLVEWPEVEDLDAERWGPKSTTRGAPPALTEPGSPTDEEATIVSTSPGESGVELGSLEMPAADDVPTAPSPEAYPPAEEHAPSSVAATKGAAASNDAVPFAHETTLRSADPSGPASSAGPGSGPASGRRPASVPFPGTATPAPEKARNGIDPKLLLAVAGIMLALAIVAFGAGLLWSRRGAPSEGPKTAAAPRPNAVASRALGVLDDALLAVASRCEIDVVGNPTGEILAIAQEGCGRTTRDARRRSEDTSQPAPLPDRPRPRDSGSTDDPRPVRTPTAGGAQRPSCITGCAGIKSQCMAACGNEPGDASKFDVWQACSGRCLASESRCRLSCR